MHDHHDLDLIADYADGIDSIDAERLLESCADCRAELALHRDVKQMMASAPAVSLSSEERAQLRAAVQAGIEQAPAPVVPLAPRRQRRWLQLGSVAAAVFVTVGIAGVVADLGGEAVSGDFQAVADMSERAGTDGAAGDDAAAFSTESASETTAAAADTTMAADQPTEETAGIMEAIPAGPLVDAGAITRAELDARIVATIDLLEADPAAPVLDAEWFNVNSERPAPACLTSEVEPVYAVINAVIDGVETQTFIVADSVTAGYRADTFVADDCSPLE